MNPARQDPLSELAPLERLHVRIARRMNRHPWKAVWTWCGRYINAPWIAALIRRQLRVHGFEHLQQTAPEKPVLLVANHRSYFDMFVVSSLVFRRLRRKVRIFFPIRGRYYYESLGGMALNFLGAFWAMYPPLFARPTHQQYDRYALDQLIDLCREGEGHVIGIHPEGGRNLDPDPYSMRRIQPGTGKIIYAARPQVIPVFIAGLGNSLTRHIAANWRGGELIRVHFGPAIDLTSLYALPAKGSTYKEVTEYVMSFVRQLAEEDRAQYGSSASGDA